MAVNEDKASGCVSATVVAVAAIPGNIFSERLVQVALRPCHRIPWPGSLWAIALLHFLLNISSFSPHDLVNNMHTMSLPQIRRRAGVPSPIGQWSVNS